MLKLKNCGTCHHWIPLRNNPEIGLCAMKGVVRGVDDQALSCYILWRPSRFTYMWCRDCDTIIHRDEVEDHIFHELHTLPYVDEDVHKETYTAS